MLHLFPRIEVVLSRPVFLLHPDPVFAAELREVGITESRLSAGSVWRKRARGRVMLALSELLKNPHAVSLAGDEEISNLIQVGF